MQQHYPQYKYIWVFSKPNNNIIPGNATKVKKGSKEYYEAYAKSEILDFRCSITIVFK